MQLKQRHCLQVVLGSNNYVIIKTSKRGQREAIVADPLQHTFCFQTSYFVCVKVSFKKMFWHSSRPSLSLECLQDGCENECDSPVHFGPSASFCIRQACLRDSFARPSSRSPWLLCTFYLPLPHCPPPVDILCLCYFLLAILDRN